MSEPYLTIGAILLVLALAVFANWKAGQPWNDLKPRVIPWRLVLIASGFLLMLLIVHLLNVLGLETGSENSPFGR